MKVLWTLLVVLLTIYAPVELTRVIIVYTELQGEYVRELIILWTLYLAAVVIVYKLLEGKKQL